MMKKKKNWSKKNEANGTDEEKWKYIEEDLHI